MFENDRNISVTNKQSASYANLCTLTVCFVRSQNCEKRLLAPSCLSAWDNLIPTRRIFMKFDICLIFETLSRKLKFH